jgi:hypothetical protein
VESRGERHRYVNIHLASNLSSILLPLLCFLSLFQFFSIPIPTTLLLTEDYEEQMMRMLEGLLPDWPRESIACVSQGQWQLQNFFPNNL